MRKLFTHQILPIIQLIFQIDSQEGTYWAQYLAVQKIDLLYFWEKVQIRIEAKKNTTFV